MWDKGQEERRTALGLGPMFPVFDERRAPVGGERQWAGGGSAAGCGEGKVVVARCAENSCPGGTVLIWFRSLGFNEIRGSDDGGGRPVGHLSFGSVVA